LSSNLGDSTAWNPQGLFRQLMGLLYLYLSQLDFFFFNRPYNPWWVLASAGLIIFKKIF
jgi:hypothetical protein